MGTPFMGFLQDEFGFNRVKAAWTFGLIIFLLGLPTVVFYNQGVFAEYDYWAGTVSLVVFAVAEIIVFSWVFGMEKGWEEINRGADIKVPVIFKFIIKWITPLILLAVFIGSLPGIWDTITFNADSGYLAEEANRPYIIFSRLLLIGVYLGLCYLVWIAYKRRVKEGRET